MERMVRTSRCLAMSSSAAASASSSALDLGALGASSSARAPLAERLHATSKRSGAQYRNRRMVGVGRGGGGGLQLRVVEWEWLQMRRATYGPQNVKFIFWLGQLLLLCQDTSIWNFKLSGRYDLRVAMVHKCEFSVRYSRGPQWETEKQREIQHSGGKWFASFHDYCKT